jgi:hypoxanthine-guanine phosphoribosyltransferase
MHNCADWQGTVFVQHISDEFVFGYGLDLDELYRNLPFIGVVRD